jgi:ribosomal protein S18 acetylase RimI-like enzyme
MPITLRPATAADLPFLQRLHRESMGPHVLAQWGTWDDVEQAKHFAKVAPEEHEIILEDGHPIGCLLVRETPELLGLSRIWIAPEAQGRGIGTRLVRELCDRAARAGLPLQLRCMKVNPAQRLYRRLGFRVLDETETHFLMEWRVG